METPLKTRLEPYLDDIRHRRITVKAVAKELNAGYTYVSKILHEIGAQPEMGQRALDRQLAAARKTHRTLVATTLPLDKAAKAANCHPRTIKRLLARMPK